LQAYNQHDLKLRDAMFAAVQLREPTRDRKNAA
jgi:hypothetical protein